MVPPSGRAAVDLAADAADGVDGVHVEVDEGDDEAADVPTAGLHRVRIINMFVWSLTS